MPKQNDVTSLERIIQQQLDYINTLQRRNRSIIEELAFVRTDSADGWRQLAAVKAERDRLKKVLAKVAWYKDSDARRLSNYTDTGILINLANEASKTLDES